MEILWRKLRGNIVAHTVLILALLTACLAAAPTWAAVGQTLSVQVRETQMRATPSFTGRTGATLSYGQLVSVLEERGAWIKARGDRGEGWIHQSALTERTLALSSGGQNVASTASNREVAAAGKGFNAETERDYRQRYPDGYAQVEAMLRYVYTPAQLQAFLKAGNLTPQEASR